MLCLDIESLFIDNYLVGGFQHVLFSISYMGRHPIDFHIFQDGYCTTNQLLNLPTSGGPKTYSTLRHSC